MQKSMIEHITGMSDKAFWLLALIFCLMLIYAYFIPLHPDEAYYWMWSRHLALGYYDGPPLTAWVIRLFTACFGIHVFTIKSVAVISVTLSAWFLYRLATVLFDDSVAIKTLIIFLFIPVTQATNFVTSLDPLFMLFWSAALYCLWQWLSIPSLARAFWLSLTIGLGLLAKYPMILFLPSSLLILACSFYRSRLLHWQPYGIVLLALVIFSPVIVWNAMHGWASFGFQWHHGTGQHHFQGHDLGMFLLGQLGAFNPVYAIGLLVLSLRYWRDYKAFKLQFLAIPLVVVLVVFGYFACFNLSEANWTMPAFLSGSILLAYFCDKHYVSITYWLGFALNIGVILLLKIPAFTPHKLVHLNPVNTLYGYAQVVQPIQPSLFTKQNLPIVSNTYQNASETAFQLASHPRVCIVTPTRKSQYTLWCKRMATQLKHKQLNQLLYIGPIYALSYFKADMHCTILNVTNYHFENINRRWAAASCQLRKPTHSK